MLTLHVNGKSTLSQSKTLIKTSKNEQQRTNVRHENLNINSVLSKPVDLRSVIFQISFCQRTAKLVVPCKSIVDEGSQSLLHRQADNLLVITRMILEICEICRSMI